MTARCLACCAKILYHKHYYDITASNNEEGYSMPPKNTSATKGSPPTAMPQKTSRATGVASKGPAATAQALSKKTPRPASAKAPVKKATQLAKISAKPAIEAKAKRPVAKQFRFGYLVHDVSRVRRTLMDEYMRPLDITRSQWSVLSTLSRGGNNGMMQVDLARLLDVGKVTVGGLVDRLEATGHVERRADATDRRAKRVYITEQGFEMLRSMILVAVMLNKKILVGVTPEELEITERVLMRVKDNIRHAIDSDDKAAQILKITAR